MKRRKGDASPSFPYTKQRPEADFFSARSTGNGGHKKQTELTGLFAKKPKTDKVIEVVDDDDDDDDNDNVGENEEVEEEKEKENEREERDYVTGTSSRTRDGYGENTYVPLPERVRPLRLEDVIGQDKAVSVIMPYLYGEGDEYDAAADASGACDGQRSKNGRYLNKKRGSRLRSIILWGPPGCGKTTLGRIIGEAIHAQDPRRPFVFLSAASCRVGDIKKASSVPGTVLFLDEIHRFNKLQQDSLLKVVEDGTITLIGATTENPSFEVRGALLSRCRVIQIERLKPRHLQVIVRRAFGKVGFAADENAISAIANMADGDARKAVNTVESVAALLVLERRREKRGEGESGEDPNSIHRIVTVEDVKRALCSKDLLFYDKAGEEHYNTISALHKSMRGGDAGASIYWLARMLEAGEDPLYVARRVVRFAAEDVGLADPRGLQLAVAAFQATHQLGMPECNVCLSLAVAYLARAPKSIAVYQAYEKAKEVIEETGTLPVPLHIRNAPTNLMEDLGYGSGYKYTPEYVAKGLDPTQEYLPEALRGTVFFTMDDLNKNRSEDQEKEKPEKWEKWEKQEKPHQPSPTRAKTMTMGGIGGMNGMSGMGQTPPKPIRLPMKTTIPVINVQQKRPSPQQFCKQKPIVIVPKAVKKEEEEKQPSPQDTYEDDIRDILDELSLDESFDNEQESNMENNMESNMECGLGTISENNLENNSDLNLENNLENNSDLNLEVKLESNLEPPIITQQQDEEFPLDFEPSILDLPLQPPPQQQQSQSNSQQPIISQPPLIPPQQYIFEPPPPQLQQKQQENIKMEEDTSQLTQPPHKSNSDGSDNTEQAIDLAATMNINAPDETIK